MTPAALTGRDTAHLTQVGDHWLNHHVVADFAMLREAAENAGFSLSIASSFRDFDRQCLIWNSKFDGRRPILDDAGTVIDPSLLTDSEKIHAILRWSALPGASRHHWGTDVDVYAKNLLPKETGLKLEPWEYDDGHQAAFSLWLDSNIERFGFFRPYQKDLGGVAREPWHISHKATSFPYLQALTPDLLSHVLSESAVLGNATIVSELDSIYSRYISNICEY
ncbi:M15 family metallopeptidase [Veronia pacifica]|uniref:Peptidase M15 n=1 Tax=Veronia pacifica TaxID=1080227 RepID=A0A1C3EER2_9GAMM|nr:M15 family metallopeptidase [Veronia pacifica]ODA31684.1 peptidase M15 [Veronia pacifica]